MKSYSKFENKKLKNKRRKHFPFMLLTNKQKYKFVSEMVSTFSLEFEAMGRKMSTSNKLRLTKKLSEIVNLDMVLLR